MKKVQVPVTHQRFTSQQRSELLDRFESCGLSVAEFAAQQGIGTSTFFRWLRQRRRQTARPPNKGKLPSSPFQEISLQSPLPTPASWAGEVELPDGTHLRWSAQTAPALLHELVAHLRSSC